MTGSRQCALVAVLLFAGLLLGVDVAAQATTPAEDAVKKTLEERIAELESRYGSGPDESTNVDPEGWKSYWKKGFRVERNDGKFKLKFGGRAQIDFGGISESAGIKERFDGTGFGVEFRRARFSFSGTVYEHGIFKAQYDFADNAPEFKDVYMGLTKLPYVGTVKVGHFKEPFSLEEMVSSNDTTFLDRSLTSAENPVRNTGAMVNRTFTEESRITAAAGAFIITNDFGDSFSDMRKYAVTLRMTGLPLEADEGKKLVHVGGGYTHRWINDLRLSQRPEVHLAPKYIDTGTIDSTDADALNGELAAVLGPFSIQGELSGFLVQQQMGPSLGFWGFYTEISYLFTGEHRPYNKKKGVFGSITPLNNFSIANGHCGAVQGAIRYSFLDLNDANIRGGRLQDITVGLNWYPFPSMRVMLNYVHAFIDESTDQNAGGPIKGNMDSLMARFQFAF